MRRVIYFLLLFCAMLSCSESSILEECPLDNLPLILKERPDQWKKSNIVNNDLLTRTGNFQSLGMQDYIGYSFKNNLYPIEDTRNIGIRVINISSFSKAYPAYFLAWKNLTTDSKSFSFTSFNKFLEKSKISKTIYHDFDLDLLGFSIGHKHTYTTTFGENRVNDSKSVLGEMHIFVRDSCYRMSYSSVINKIILKSYLDKSYEKELHSIHPYEFYNKYGGFIASDYSSGGRAIALYSALSRSNDDDEEKESNLDKEIEASVSWDKSSSINNNLKFGRGGNTTVSITKSFSSVKMCVKTIGGSTSGGFSIPQEINNSSIDLSGWLSSLGVKENHVIAEFNENGLIPISDFIFEQNLKTLFNDYIANKNIPVNTNIIEPYILIGQVNSISEPVSINEAQIITRYGYHLPLLRFGTVVSQDGLKEFWRQIDELANIFQIQVRNASALSIPSVSTNAVSGPYWGEYINLLAHKDTYSKLVHNGMLYFIDEQDKVGFSILNNKEDAAEYGLIDFLSKLRPASISYSSMIEQGYVINAL